VREINFALISNCYLEFLDTQTNLILTKILSRQGWPGNYRDGGGGGCHSIFSLGIWEMHGLDRCWFSAQHKAGNVRSLGALLEVNDQRVSSARTLRSHYPGCPSPQPGLLLTLSLFCAQGG
jgi:hypothetical protein